MMSLASKAIGVGLSVLTVFTFARALPVITERIETSKSEEVPSVVEELFSEYVRTVAGPQTQVVFPFNEYIKGAADVPDNLHDKGSTVENEAFFDAVTVGSAEADYVECEPVTNTFCLIRLYKADGTMIGAPVGFWWRLDSDGKISEYKLGRLQPFSKLDQEYSEVIG